MGKTQGAPYRIPSRRFPGEKGDDSQRSIDGPIDPAEVSPYGSPGELPHPLGSRVAQGRAGGPDAAAAHRWRYVAGGGGLGLDGSGARSNGDSAFRLIVADSYTTKREER